MKKLLNQLHTPDSWKRELYSEIERTETAPAKADKSRKITMRICMGAVAACAAFAMVFTMAPKNSDYTLLLSAEEVASYAELEFKDMAVLHTGVALDGEPVEISNMWYEYPNGSDIFKNGDEYGMVDAQVFGQIPVRVSGDNIESVTLIPHSANNNVSLVIVSPTDDAKEFFRMGQDSKPSVTLSYEEQFDPTKIVALRWDYKEPGIDYSDDTGRMATIDPETGKLDYILSYDPTAEATPDTTVDVQINYKDGSTKTVTVSATHELPFEIGSTEKFVYEQVK